MTNRIFLACFALAVPTGLSAQAANGDAPAKPTIEAFRLGEDDPRL